VRSRRRPYVPVRLLLDANGEHDHHLAADDGARAGHNDDDADSLELRLRLWKMTEVERRPFLTSPIIVDHFTPMLSWIITFLIIALIAGALGFTGIAGTSMGIAQTLFYIFLVLFVISLLVHLVRGGGSKTDL
jgi:uncharacterized membrane protein YtjA (UPF0391 family)